MLVLFHVASAAFAPAGPVALATRCPVCRMQEDEGPKFELPSFSLPKLPSFGDGDEPSAPARPNAGPNSRWPDESLLNTALPDPVYDEPSPYLGRVPWGFSATAENLNGKAAMMGFTILFLQELVFGKGVLELYGIPLDPGAIGG